MDIAFPWLITWPWLIKLDADGETKTVRGGAMPGTVAIGVVGHAGPRAFGLGAAQLIESGYILSMFWVALVLLTVMLLAARLSFAFVTVPAARVLAFLIAKFEPMRTQVIAAYGLAWLLLSGVRTVVEHGLRAEDARILRGATGIPRLLWLGGTLAALVIGGRMLVMQA